MADVIKLSANVLTLVSPAGRTVNVRAVDATPTDGTSGTGAGEDGPGSIALDAVNAKQYQNTNTKASPLWTLTGIQTT